MELSIRPFIGTRDFDTSRQFYKDLGFKEDKMPISDMVRFEITDKLSFYLQKRYKRTWVRNSMIFLEVDDIERYWHNIRALQLEDRYKTAKQTEVQKFSWGREFFMHDPSGVLWHIGQFDDDKKS